MERDFTKHHLLFPRKEWVLRPESRRIRQSPSMIPMLDQESHDYMHETVPFVPTLGLYTLRAVEKLWQPEGNTIDDIDSLCLAMERASSPINMHPLERQLAAVAIEALLLEKQVLYEVGIVV